MRHTKIHKQTIEFITNILNRRGIQTQEIKEKNELTWVKSRIYILAIVNTMNIKFLISIFIYETKENKDKNSVRIIISVPGGKYYHKEFNISEYKSFEHYLNAIQNELDNILNLLNI